MPDQRRPASPSRETLLHLLAEAAELEHNLLCAYLYAYFSLKRPEELGSDRAGAAAVARWRKTLLSVCMEEMGHLAQVANLTVALGARPHFNRPNLPVAPGYHPAGVVIALQGFSMESLQHFIYLERSQHDPVDDCPPVPPEPFTRPAAVPPTLMPAAPEYSTIGEFYGTLRDQFESFCGQAGSAAFAQADCTQLRGEEIGLPGLVVVTDAATAHQAIDLIVVQGEGGRGDDGADSHFARFVGMQQELEQLLAGNGDFQPAHPVARNPVMRVPVSDDRVHVNAAPAVQWLDACNAAYGLMLRALAALYDLPWSRPAQRKAAVDTALWSMHQLASHAEKLARLPARTGSAAPNAGPTFTMLRATEGWASGTDVSALLAERRRELEPASGQPRAS